MVAAAFQGDRKEAQTSPEGIRRRVPARSLSHCYNTTQHGISVPGCYSSLDRLRMPTRPTGIFRLSNELLRDVLDQIEADPDKLVNLDRRAYLSQESFRLPALPSPNQAQDIASFRLTCRRFSELGAIHQFARVTTRFSRRGLRRLDWIAGQPHLARHVKKFSYMVPYFYVEGMITILYRCFRS